MAYVGEHDLKIYILTYRRPSRMERYLEFIEYGYQIRCIGYSGQQIGEENHYHEQLQRF